MNMKTTSQCSNRQINISKNTEAREKYVVPKIKYMFIENNIKGNTGGILESNIGPGRSS